MTGDVVPAATAFADAVDLSLATGSLHMAVVSDRLALTRTPESAWCQVVEIRPTRLQSRPPQGQGETIDLW